MVDLDVRGRQFKKSFALLNVFQQILPQKQLIYQAFFVFGLNLELQGSLKVRCSEINSMLSKFSKSKIS